MKVIELHHVGFGVNHAQADAMLDFYRNVLALPQDPSRWKIPGIYGSWFNLPNGTQLHILGCEGVSQYAKGPDQDPVSNHFALAVEDILAAEQELVEQGIEYFTLDNVASPDLKQLFLRDPAGNLIELHQATARRAGVAVDEQQTCPIANR
ncbi:VOC family protein [Alcaligenes nematophilus]|uniref:VOC family protein n=1 Tax=Alcaligenes nematophilus TaxID=2994643 RepID=UPI00245CF402|nr:VOC family protein [Alcaligenes nematophilus]MDH4866982.1 VOC family protein [Bacillus cereus]MDY7128286.1 VOC family protein [Alcaligenes nematophilus]